MSNYTQITFFAPKDALLSGNPAKLIKGADVDPELAAIATAIASKYDATNFAFANPSATIGLTAVNGSATTPMRSDAAPALSQSISPTWSALHTFGHGAVVTGVASSSLGTSALVISGSSTSGQSNGLFVAAGTNASDNVIRLQNQAQTTNFFILTGNGAGSLGPSGSLGLAWNAAGNVSSAAPSSGVAFTATGIASQYAAVFTAGGTSGTQKGLSAVTTTQNATDKIINVNNSLSNLLDIFGDGHGDIGPNLSWTAGGNWSIAVPTSGISAVINGLNANYVLQLASTSAANVLGFGWNVGNTSNAWNVFSQGNDPLSVGTNGTQSLFLVTAGTTRVNVNGNGAISVSAPSVGTALSVTGLANATTALVQGSSTSGQSFGLRVQAGTTAADNGFIVTNPAGSVNYFEVRGDGVVLGNDGTNLFELGYKDAPQNTQTTSYTLALSDRGKSIVMNGTSLTLTIPANASIAFPPGATIVGVNKNATALTVAITTDTLVLAGTSTTGSRSVATNGLFTLYKSLTGEWLISGSGVT